MELHASDVAASSAASTRALILPLTLSGGAGAPLRMRERYEVSKDVAEVALDELGNSDKTVESIGFIID